MLRTISFCVGSGPSAGRIRPLTAFLALATALTGCGDDTPRGDPFQVGLELLPKAGPLCTAAYDSGQSIGTPAPGSIKGQVVGLTRSADGTWYPLGYALLPTASHHAQARSADAVQAVVCVRGTSTQVGVYQPGNVPAVRTDEEFRVIRWPSGEPLARTIFRGPEPPAQKEAPKDSKLLSGGSPPTYETGRWLDELIAH